MEKRKIATVGAGGAVALALGGAAYFIGVGAASADNSGAIEGELVEPAANVAITAEPEPEPVVTVRVTVTPEPHEVRVTVTPEPAANGDSGSSDQAQNEPAPLPSAHGAVGGGDAPSSEPASGPQPLPSPLSD